MIPKHFIVKSAYSIVELMGIGPFLKKRTSKWANSITQPDVFEGNGSQKGSKMAQTLIKPMENDQTRAPESIFCMKYFLYIQKSFSYVHWGNVATMEEGYHNN